MMDKVEQMRQLLQEYYDLLKHNPFAGLPESVSHPWKRWLDRADSLQDRAQKILSSQKKEEGV